jgi:molecular chaperone GrpE
MSKKHEDKDKKIENPPTGGKEFENLENQLKKALADYQNLEKRIAEEKANWIKLATRGFILRILPTLDHLDTALKGAKDSGDTSSWLNGIELAVGEFRKALQEEGLEPVGCESFDPNFHEAIGVSDGPEGKIIDVAQMGYTLNGKLIRPAKVIVGKQKEL